MNKTSLTMALAAAALVLAACGKSEAPASAPAPAPAPAAEAPAAAPAPAAPVAENTAGKSAYGKTCAMCHAAGVAGAPKLGDKAAWDPRIAQGMDTMMKIAINGKGAMPPRGASTASDDELRAAVQYMVDAAK